MKPSTHPFTPPRPLQETSSPPPETHLDFYRRWGRMAAPYFKWQYDQLRAVSGAPHRGRRLLVAPPLGMSVIMILQ